MIIYDGKAVFEGIAIGKISVYTKQEQLVKRIKVDDPEAEKKRYADAREVAIEQLKGLYEKAVKEVGESGAEIFEAHQLMVDDEDYIESVENIIDTEEVNAEYAVAQTGDNFAKMFAEMEEEYFRGRAADIKDITERVLNALLGAGSGGIETDEPVIVVADDLAPSETVQMDKDKILSFVTVHGSANSHTSILAKTMSIPAIIGCPIPLSDEVNGKLAVVDGYEGKVYVEPDQELLAEKKKLLLQEEEKKNLLERLKGKDNITLDGQKINLYANIGNTKDLGLVLENDAGGIGLFRSEFIYLGSDDYPTEEEQFAIYKQVAQTLAGKKVIIRTLDIGADKQADYFELPKEENPAMGLRAIRICLTRPEVFKTQLRAILRASAFGKISIMFPMIISVDEVKKIKKIVEEVKESLDADGLSYDKNIELGIMIETPAAVIIADELAEEVDFFSVGTNDLTQYTLAIDRQNQSLDDFYDSHHPAILKMLKMIADAAHRHGAWAGICGELGADLSLTKDFLAMGYDELSVSPGRILPIRKTVLETNVTEYKKEKGL
ncbi:MAG: phosphoenolpyruvate--protein phosphotransferase [Eubacterium sp.]|nr:phosphoenolpyruvate--protein phosphotransferase [Eubacterium sp.]MEE3398764.1 phosphoenolpyruvate--protein phosphotransferase [Eubacterium sp.]